MLDSYYTIRLVSGGWRDFDEECNELNIIADIIRNGSGLSELDKLTLAKHIANGYAVMENNRPRLLIPAMTKDEYAQLGIIFTEIISELGKGFFTKYTESYAEQVSKELPSFLPAGIRNFYKYLIQPHYAALYRLNNNGKLRTPSDEEAKRMCLIVWQA
jgi:hypothetical protein